MHRNLFGPLKPAVRLGVPTAEPPSGETEAALMAMGQAIELRDPDTGGHCERLAFHSLALGLAMGLSRADLISLHRGGYLHDVGKVGIPDAILFKPSALNEEEWSMMRQHPVLGESICSRLRALAPVLPVIRHHHERWDGSGYPDGLRGTAIPLLARVLQFADIYDALTATRPYKRAYTPRQALAIMEEETARGWRDPELMELFLRLHRKVVCALDGCVFSGVDWIPMEESLNRLERHLAEDARPVRKPARRSAKGVPRREEGGAAIPAAVKPVAGVIAGQCPP